MTTRHSADPAHRTRLSRPRRWWSRWPRWSGAVAVLVLTGYGLGAAGWFAGGPYAFARPANPDNTFPDHWLADLPAARVEAVTIGFCALVVAALLLMRRAVGGPLRPVLLGIGWSAAAFLALVLPGTQALDAIPGLNLLNLKRLDWPTVHLVLLAYTGYAVAAATLAYGRLTRARCVNCGRDGGAEWPRQRWARVGVLVSIAAFVAPFGYAIVRLCWAAGIPVGTTEEFLATINAANPGHGTVLLELILSGMAIGGGLLCLGLTRPWSQVWPRWLIGLAGRPVPHWFPAGLATVCGGGLFGFTTLLVPDLVRFATGAPVFYPGTGVRTNWLSHVPTVSLLLWGALVLAAAAAFHYRTRSRCVHCGRGGCGQPSPASSA
ncbi:hypothetical protein [Plantactinospora sp. GCM10030261]|uniref:hypothetical protein n=1 Tax=Plantactinospora sp. GCM10030261 TaxID=3273420 RepID=UPI0036175B8B